MDKKIAWRFVLAVVLTAIAVVLFDAIAGLALRGIIYLSSLSRNGTSLRVVSLLLLMGSGFAGYGEIILDGVVARRLAPCRKKVFSLVGIPIFLVAWYALVFPIYLAANDQTARDFLRETLQYWEVTVILISYLIGLIGGYGKLWKYGKNANQTE